MSDHGNTPYVVDIEKLTKENETFRTAIWTGKNLQVTVMSIPVGGEVGLEIHHDIDQFLRVEAGTGKALMGKEKDALTVSEEVEDDSAIHVPAGYWHNIVNTGDTPLKLYSIYAPAEHPFGTVHQTFEEALEAEAEHHQ